MPRYGKYCTYVHKHVCNCVYTPSSFYVILLHFSSLFFLLLSLHSFVSVTDIRFYCSISTLSSFYFICTPCSNFNFFLIFYLLNFEYIEQLMPLFLLRHYCLHFFYLYEYPNHHYPFCHHRTYFFSDHVISWSIYLCTIFFQILSFLLSYFPHCPSSPSISLSSIVHHFI